ncbi:MAG: GxxExxY protein [Phycisphaerae bacterium]|nr:GxxExxY protein [Phycisphaerae bacterium]
MYNDSPRGRDGHRGPRGGRDEYESRERRGVPLSELDPALTEVSRKVIGCSIEVHKALGPGFSEDVYTNALCHELDQLGVKHRVGHSFPVIYKGKKVGERPADLFVDDRFIVEIMAEHREINSLDRANLRAQLRAADLELGLIINYAERRLKDGLVRVLNPEKIPSLRGSDQGDEGHESAVDPDRVA